MPCAVHAPESAAYRASRAAAIFLLGAGGLPLQSMTSTWGCAVLSHCQLARQTASMMASRPSIHVALPAYLQAEAAGELGSCRGICGTAWPQGMVHNEGKRLRMACCWPIAPRYRRAGFARRCFAPRIADMPSLWRESGALIMDDADEVRRGQPQRFNTPFGGRCAAPEACRRAKSNYSLPCARGSGARQRPRRGGEGWEGKSTSCIPPQRRQQREGHAVRPS